MLRHSVLRFVLPPTPCFLTALNKRKFASSTGAEPSVLAGVATRGAGVNYYFFNNNAFQSLGFIKIAIGIN